MNYFYRESRESHVSGPFTVDVLENGIRQHRFSLTGYASSDLGESKEQLIEWSTNDWFPLWSIPAIRDQFDLQEAPPPSQIKRREQPGRFRRTLDLSLLALVFILPTEQQRWITAIVAVSISLLLYDYLARRWRTVEAESSRID